MSTTPRVPWRRLAQTILPDVCRQPRCTTQLVAIVVADGHGTRAVVYVCPDCDGRGPTVVEAERVG